MHEFVFLRFSGPALKFHVKQSTRFCTYDAINTSKNLLEIESQPLDHWRRLGQRTNCLNRFLNDLLDSLTLVVVVTSI